MVSLAIGSLAPSPRTRAGDWPQVLGPTRMGVADGESLPDKLPKDVKPLWSLPAGQGFAGPAVAGGRVYLFHRIDDEERLDCRELRSGKEIWSRGLPATYRGTISDDNGPRCVPLVAGERVYVFGAAGTLHAVERSSGKLLWSRNLARDTKAQEGYFGFGSSPILVGDRLLVNAGGKPEAGLVALDPATGKTVWTAVDDAASYSSPTVARVNDRTVVLFVTRLKFVAVDPVSGEVLGTIPFGQRGPTVNAASPLVLGDQVFLTASYGIGARLIRLSPQGLETAWEDAETISSQYTTPVEYNGHLYAIDGRDDQGAARLVCFDYRERKVRWAEEGFGMATIVRAGDKLLLLKTDGSLVLARANPAKWESLGEATLFTSTTRALPALSGGVLIARDTRTWSAWGMGQ